MTSAKKPSRKTPEEFIAAAPDGGRSAKPLEEQGTKKRGRIIRGKKQQLTLTFPPATVDRVDAAAAKLGMTRTGWISLAVHLQLDAAGA